MHSNNNHTYVCTLTNYQNHELTVLALVRGDTWIYEATLLGADRALIVKWRDNSPCQSKYEAFELARKEAISRLEGLFPS